MRDAEQILKRVNLLPFRLLYWQGILPTEDIETRTADEM